jgi:hypothetical protein
LGALPSRRASFAAGTKSLSPLEEKTTIYQDSNASNSHMPPGNKRKPLGFCTRSG